MQTKEIKIIDIEFDDKQPRKDITKIGELAGSIMKEGLINPIEVIDIGKGKYRLIDGERRLRALKLIKKKTVPAFVTNKVENVFIRQLITDFHKEKLNLVEQAEALKKLDDGGYEPEAVRHLLGIKKTKYFLLKKTLGLNRNTKKQIIAGRITTNMIQNLTREDLRPEKEDEIVKEIINSKAKSRYEIDKIVLEKSNIRYMINKYLTDSFTFMNRTSDFNNKLMEKRDLIDLEIKDAIRSNGSNVERDLMILKDRIERIIRLFKYQKELAYKTQKTQEVKK